MTCLKKSILLILSSLLLYPITSWGQDIALQHLIQGKKFFWEAKFDQAVTELEKVVETEGAKQEYLYDAHLYMGFILVRQNAPKSEIQETFGRAIRLDPQREVDTAVIPPDLAEAFHETQNQLVGCVYVKTDPDEVGIIGVKGDSILFNKMTPIRICELVESDFQLLLTRSGYEDQFVPLELTAGITDTLFVTLTPMVAELEQTETKSKKVWPWVFRGGIIAAVGAVLYTTVIEAKGNEGGNDLPGPPGRPEQPQ